jgi:predicted esterase
MNKYYTSFEMLKDMFDKDQKVSPYKMTAENEEELKCFQTKLRQRLISLTAIDKIQKSPLNPKTLERVEFDGYIREKVLIQTEDKVYMPFFVLIPSDIKEGEKRPCIIAPHGHGSSGKAMIAGDASNPAVAEKLTDFESCYGLSLVKDGFIVLCPDARGSGERREWMNQGEEGSKVFESSCTQLNFAAISLGRTLLGMWIFDLMRLIDYVEESDLPLSGKIGCIGFSGGGLQSLWLGALDERVDCTVIGGYFHGLRDSIMKTNMCGCNFVPGLWQTTDIGDIASLICPRPVLVESGIHDKLNGERGMTDVYEQAETLKKAYSIMKADENFMHYPFEGGHQYCSTPVAGWFKKWLW